ncbi:MAG: DUF1152 domain-containing protein [Anaerolineae bacterium]|nr:DUF1152 domain-containing protein [Anaerolineae bacterium]
MQLNLPIWDSVRDCNNLLIAGMGGGFDVFCGLPVYFTLRELGMTVHLGNFSFSDLTLYDSGLLHNGIRLTDTLIGVQAEDEDLPIYFPELHLAEWFREARGEDVTVWTLHKTGARPLIENYRVLVEHLGIDGILLIDGGVDSLSRGNEALPGTVVEDWLSLLAVHTLQDVPVRVQACLGFGAEREVTHAHALENIAALMAAGGFLGGCALTSQMPAYQAYDEAVIFVQAKAWQDPSVINSSVISAVRGYYGDFHLTEKTRGSRLWISPLMSLYWFFDLETVAGHNHILPLLAETEQSMEALYIVMRELLTRHKRPTAKIPL